MALLDEVVSTTTGGIVAGVAVAVIAPAILPAEMGLRNVAKSVVRGLLAVSDTVISAGLAVADHFGDLVGEARDELAAGTRGVPL